MHDDNRPPMPDPLAYLITWSTYGTWLPGDQRGWTDYHHGWQLPDPIKRLEAAARMSEDACRLDAAQREAVQKQIGETCRFRDWFLHAVNCRTNHVHVVITAPLRPKSIRSQLKAWCTRRLKELAADRGATSLMRDNWWAERGSGRYINDETSLEAAIWYVKDAQDKPR